MTGKLKIPSNNNSKKGEGKMIWNRLGDFPVKAKYQNMYKLYIFSIMYIRYKTARMVQKQEVSTW